VSFEDQLGRFYDAPCTVSK